MSRLFTRKQERFVRIAYKRMTIREVTAALNARFRTKFSFGQVNSLTNRKKMLSGRTVRFSKGHIPFNFGSKGKYLCGFSATRFKKGHKPANLRPVGSTRIDSKDGYVLVKIRERDPHTGFPTRFKAKHVVVWERAHGPLPKGHAVVFKNGDRRDIRRSNLILLSRSELVRLNQLGFMKYPKRIRPSIIALAKLRSRAFELERKLQG